MTSEILTLLRMTVSHKIHGDEVDFCPNLASGGSYDDAYNMGVEDGETIMARRILALLERAGLPT